MGVIVLVFIEIPLKYVSKGPVNNTTPALIGIMDWRRGEAIISTNDGIVCWRYFVAVIS